MKHTLALTLFLSVSLATNACAQFVGASRHEKVTTVEQAKAARRGQAVTLEGFVVENLRGNYYKFRDGTGEIRTRINRHVWRNRKLTSKNPVRLHGKIDREVRELYVVVDRLQILDGAPGDR